MMNNFEEILEEIRVKNDESTEVFISRLSKHLSTKRKK